MKNTKSTNRAKITIELAAGKDGGSDFDYDNSFISYDSSSLINAEKLEPRKLLSNLEFTKLDCIDIFNRVDNAVQTNQLYNNVPPILSKSPVSPDPTKLQTREEKFNSVLGALPGEFQELTRELASATHDYREAIAKRLQPRLIAHINAMPQETLEQKKGVQAKILEVLEPLSLAVRCPKTDRPAKLKAAVGSKEGSNHFHYEVYIDGKRVITAVTTDLTTLSLMDEFPPPEIQTHFRDLVTRTLKPRQR
jgi:hypothetical protein